jgi:hypothetical protein
MPLGRIVSFINQNSTVLFDSVPVRGIGASAHEQDAKIRTEMKMHSMLEADAPGLAHFNVGDDLPRSVR